MEDVKKITDKVRKRGTSLLNGATKHRFILIFVILGAAIAFALLRTQSFLSIPRNENRFNEGKALINYKQIDTATLESFKSALNDQDAEVD
jgi:hypothetical protein